MSSPTKSITLQNLHNKYAAKETDRFSDLKRVIQQNNDSLKFTKLEQETQSQSSSLGQQFMDYINLQRKKKKQALTQKKAQKDDDIKLKSTTQEDETDAIRNVRVQKAVEKIKSKLKNQHTSKDQKFENKFTAFTGLSTFVDVRAFLQNINNAVTSDTKKQSPTTGTNRYQEILEASDDEVQDDAYKNKEVLVRSKELILANKVLIDLIQKKRIGKSDEFSLIKLEQLDGYNNGDEEEKKFFKYMDQILASEIKQLNMTDEKLKELEQFKKDNSAIMNRFNQEIEYHRSVDMKKKNIINQPVKEEVFIMKSKKILQLLEKTTNHIFKKLTLPSKEFVAPDQMPLQQVVTMRQFRCKQVQPEYNVLSSVDETKASNTTLPIINLIKQSTPKDIQKFQDQINRNVLLKRGVSLHNLMDMKKFVYDNSVSLKKIKLPKLEKGLSELFDSNKRVLVQQDLCAKSKSQSLCKINLKEATDNNVHHFNRYTTSPQVVHQRNQLSLLIQQVDQTQLAMRLELPLYKCEMNRFEDELNLSKKKLKPQALESLSYFSKSERSDARLVPKKRQQKGIQIL